MHESPEYYNPLFAFGKNVIECHLKKIEDGLKTADLYMKGDGSCRGINWVQKSSLLYLKTEFDLPHH